MNPLTCDDLVKYLSAYLDGELDDDLTVAAQTHLATCERCQVVLDSTQRVLLLGKGQSVRAIPAARREALFDRVRAALEASERQN